MCVSYPHRFWLEKQMENRLAGTAQLANTWLVRQWLLKNLLRPLQNRLLLQTSQISKKIILSLQNYI